jgi:hypothetical protein
MNSHHNISPFITLHHQGATAAPAVAMVAMAQGAYGVLPSVVDASSGDTLSEPHKIFPEEKAEYGHQGWLLFDLGKNRSFAHLMRQKAKTSFDNGVSTGRLFFLLPLYNACVAVHNQGAAATAALRSGLALVDGVEADPARMDAFLNTILGKQQQHQADTINLCFESHW